jgi:hypothetical protein
VTRARPVANRPSEGAPCRPAPPRQADFLLPELEALLATAAAVICRHVSEAGWCRECSCEWPCEPAQLADLVLGGF